MPEYWFKYGTTEVSMEVPDEIDHRKIETGKVEISEKIWEELRSFTCEVVRDAGPGHVAILYDHVDEDLSLTILRHVVDTLTECGKETILLISCWRLSPEIGLEHAKHCLKKYGVSTKIVEAGELKRVPVNGLEIVKEFLDASARMVITTSELHGILGKASFEEALALGGLLNLEFGGAPADAIKMACEIVCSEAPFQVVTQMDGRTYFGEVGDIDKMLSKSLGELLIPVGDAEIVIAGGGGHPRDSTLQSILHVFGLLRDAVLDGGLVGLVAECGGGLGSKEFLEALLRGGGRGLDAEAIKLLKEMSENRRMALTSTLPKTILGKLLNIRGFDVPQELLTYGLKLYGKDTKLLVLEKPAVRPVRRQTME